MWRRALPFLFLLACEKDEPVRPPLGEGTGTSPPSRGGGGGGTTADAAIADAGADADAGPLTCTALAIDGPVVDLVAVADNPPPGLGGSIIPGTYDLTSATFYAGLASLPGPTNTTYQAALEIDQQQFERAIVFRGANGSTQELRVAGGFTPAGVNGNATIGLTCPSNAQELVTYTVTGNNLVITDNASKIALTFAKRP